MHSRLLDCFPSRLPIKALYWAAIPLRSIAASELGRYAPSTISTPQPMADRIEPETERLRLRQWLPADREPFAALNADPRVMAFLPSRLTRTESDALADRCQHLIQQQGWGLWATTLKASDQFIGFVGLHRPSPQLPCSPGVEIGWRLAFDYWGQGLATEAARAALQVGFIDLNLPPSPPWVIAAPER